MRLEKVPSALQQVRSKLLTLTFPEDYSYGCSYYAWNYGHAYDDDDDDYYYYFNCK